MNASSTRTRRLTARLAVAGALIAIPVTALAIPASAAVADEVPAAVEIARPHGPGGPGFGWPRPSLPPVPDRYHHHGGGPGLCSGSFGC